MFSGEVNLLQYWINSTVVNLLCYSVEVTFSGELILLQCWIDFVVVLN